MDPTTKEGRAELRETWGKRTSNMRVLRDAAPTDVRWSAEYELAAQTFALFAHIDRLEAEGIRLSKFVLVREAERSALRVELERAREALRAFIAWMDDSRTPGHAVNPVRYMAHCDLLDDADRLARAILANHSETPNGSAAPTVTDEMAEVLRETLRDLGNGSVSLAHARAALTEALRRTP